MTLETTKEERERIQRGHAPSEVYAALCRDIDTLEAELDVCHAANVRLREVLAEVEQHLHLAFLTSRDIAHAQRTKELLIKITQALQEAAP